MILDVHSSHLSKGTDGIVSPCLVVKLQLHLNDRPDTPASQGGLTVSVSKHLSEIVKRTLPIPLWGAVWCSIGLLQKPQCQQSSVHSVSTRSGVEQGVSPPLGESVTDLDSAAGHSSSP